MAKQQKAKPTPGTRNENRKNGKAFKKRGNVKRGQSRTTLTDVQKVLLGTGLLVGVDKRWKVKR